jgi:hypothetical protein
MEYLEKAISLPVMLEQGSPHNYNPVCIEEHISSIPIDPFRRDKKSQADCAISRPPGVESFRLTAKGN